MAINFEIECFWNIFSFFNKISHLDVNTRHYSYVWLFFPVDESITFLPMKIIPSASSVQCNTHNLWINARIVSWCSVIHAYCVVHNVYCVFFLRNTPSTDAIQIRALSSLYLIDTSTNYMNFWHWSLSEKNRRFAPFLLLARKMQMLAIQQHVCVCRNKIEKKIQPLERVLLKYFEIGVVSLIFN